MSMTPDRLAELKKAAEAATQDEWKSVDPAPDEAPNFTIVAAHAECGSICDFYNYTDVQDRANRDFVVAASPATVLELLDYIDQLHADVERLTKDRDKWEAEAVMAINYLQSARIAKEASEKRCADLGYALDHLTWCMECSETSLEAGCSDGQKLFLALAATQPKGTT